MSVSVSVDTHSVPVAMNALQHQPSRYLNPVVVSVIHHVCAPRDASVRRRNLRIRDLSKRDNSSQRTMQPGGQVPLGINNDNDTSPGTPCRITMSESITLSNLSRCILC